MKKLLLWIVLCGPIWTDIACIDTAGYRPGPSPGPHVTATDLWVLVFDDPSRNSQETGLLLGDKGYWDTVASRGHSWMELSGTGDDAKPYKKYIDQAGLPCVLFLDKKKPAKNYLGVEKLPKDKPGMDLLVKKYSGK
jgi:hypothetical protein